MWFIIVLWAITLVLLWFGTRSLDRVDVERWADRFSVPVDAEVEGFLRRRLRRARASRTGGLVIGLNVAMLPMYWNLVDAERASVFANDAVESAGLVGPMLGALAAELFVVQRPLARRTDLVRRRASDYVDHVWLRVIAAMTAIAIGGAVAATVLESWRWRWTWVGAGAAVLALIAVVFGARAVIARPLIVPEGPLRAADEALRAHGVHCIVGAGVALGSFGVLTSVGRAADWGVVWIVVALMHNLSLGAWWQLAARSPWSVEQARGARPDRAPA